MKRFLLIFAVILAAAPRVALSQCTDSSTLAANNYYLLKGAEAREELALCREFRKVDAEVIAEMDKIQAKLLNELQARDKRYNKLKRASYTIATLFFLSLIL